MKNLSLAILLTTALLQTACVNDRPVTARDHEPPIRCAVIGGVASTGLWRAVTEKFEAQSGYHVQVVVAGPKDVVAQALIDGKADLVTIHAGDTIVNLVADGYAADLRPWVKNDLVIVGPVEDPAHIKGMTDAVAALRKIIESKSTFLVQSSAGAFDMLHDLLDAGDLALDMDDVDVLLEDRNKRVLQEAAAEKAYTIVGRIPFYNGKLENDGMAVMVQGDPRMRRPFLVAVAATASGGNAGVKALEAFLCGPEARKIIATFGKGTYDDQPLFFPVNESK